MFGRMLNETIGKAHFWITFVGSTAFSCPCTFWAWPATRAAIQTQSGVNFLAPLHGVHFFITVAAMITIGAQLVFLFNFLYSLKFGAKASENPWNATTLEWSIPSPPPFDNFAGHVPEVYRGPYELSVPGAADDFIPQHLAPELVARAD